MAVGTAVRETELYLEAIERLNPKLNAVLTVTADMALEQARGRCGGGKREWLGILHGVPMLVKGCLNVTGVRTTFGTDLYRDNISNSDSAVVERARKCGPVFLGKTNLAEFCYGATTQTTHNISRNNTALGASDRHAAGRDMVRRAARLPRRGRVSVTHGVPPHAPEIIGLSAARPPRGYFLSGTLPVTV